MDILLVFYILLFLSIIFFPFVFLVWNYKDETKSPFGESPREDLVDLIEEKSILISNLTDLKAEEETGKLKIGEFRSLSQDILVELYKIDQEILKIENSKEYPVSIPTTAQVPENFQSNTHFSDLILFCPQCGTRKIEEAKFCHHCGTSLVEKI